MNIFFSSATIQAYENQNKQMDLFYNPILIFENLSPDKINKIEDIKWTINSDITKSFEFEIIEIRKSTLADTDNKVFVEFKLAKRELAFSYDDYSCNINFTACLEGEMLEYEVLGVVKTKWSKNLI